MKTEILKIDAHNICMDKLKYAADIIKNGGLVAFPTETVYGLGANALQKGAIKKIFEAKGRPSDNPLIVHIADIAALEELAVEPPSVWQKLAGKFWPGPLTLIFKKSPVIPSEITAGLDTVAVRMPAHPIALALIEESSLPIAAPSANSSGRPSPTLASHVIEDLDGKIDLIIDGGSANIGLESTVLDITSNPPLILRPGGLTLEQLRIELPDVELDPAISSKDSMAGNNNLKEFIPKSPGLKYKHYSPKAQLIIVEGSMDKVVCRINELSKKMINEGKKIGVLSTDHTKPLYKSSVVMSLGDRSSPDTIASNLFLSFREMDRQDVDVIFAEAIDKNGLGLAIMNRMKKAAGYNIIKV
ncbi:MAG TPA: L-threonylcarbamoyladenylate synthase [Clostridiales bacterium]|nr:L-threonylcarbamoyladenylate synthase [Clostridiales bacterium]